MPQTPGVADHGAKYDVVADDVVEPKTKAGAVGAGGGAIVAAFIDYMLDVLFYGGVDTPPEVPFPVSALVLLAVTSGGAFLGSYLARHVNRPNPVT